MYNYETSTLGEAWILVLDTILSQGEEIVDDDLMLTEIRNVYISIDSISDCDPILKRYADRDRIALMKEKYATCGLVGDYKIDYGSYIYDNNGVNQIEWVIDRIKRKPETKSATIGLHKPGEEMLACLSLLDFKLREERLDMSCVYRSQNAFWSMPGNMLALRNIQGDVANELGVPVGKTDLIVFSSHIYKHHYQIARETVHSFHDELEK